MEITPQMPVYVKIDEYKDVMDILNLVKNKINEAKKVLSRIYDIKSQEDAELDAWNNELEEVERKINYIDSTLLEPGA